MMLSLARGLANRTEPLPEWAPPLRRLEPHPIPCMLTEELTRLADARHHAINPKEYN